MSVPAPAPTRLSDFLTIEERGGSGRCTWLRGSFQSSAPVVSGGPAAFVAEAAMRWRCRGADEIFNLWLGAIESGGTLDTAERRRVAPFVQTAFGLPERPLPADQVEGHVAECLWYILAGEQVPTGRELLAREGPSFAVTGPGGDGLAVYRTEGAVALVVFVAGRGAHALGPPAGAPVGHPSPLPAGPSSSPGSRRRRPLLRIPSRVRPQSPSRRPLRAPLRQLPAQHRGHARHPGGGYLQPRAVAARRPPARPGRDHHGRGQDLCRGREVLSPPALRRRDSDPLPGRSRLARDQARDQFLAYASPDTGRRFGGDFVVQVLRSNRIDPSANVVICTIRRLYSVLRGDPTFEPAAPSQERLPLQGRSR